MSSGPNKMSSMDELDFSSEELAEMNVDLAREPGAEGEEPPKRKKRGLRVPVDPVPRPETEAAVPREDKSTVRLTAQHPIDALVEYAFTSGGRAEGIVSAEAPLAASLARDGVKTHPKAGSASIPTPPLDDADIEPDIEISGYNSSPRESALHALARAVAPPENPGDTPQVAPLLAALGVTAPQGVPRQTPSMGVPQPVATTEITEDLELDGEDVEEVSPPPPAPQANAPVNVHDAITAPSRADTPAQPPTPPPAPQPRDTAAPRAAADSADTNPLRTRRRRRVKQWFEEIFDDDYLRTLPFLTAKQTAREAQFVDESLGLQKGAQVLDLACGYGRHAMELAARGYKVTGFDLSLPLLIKAADAARKNGVNISFVHGDMREMTFDAEFDGAYCLFTSFGYFDDDTNRKVAANLSRALRPGGRLLVEVINRDYLVRDLPTRVWWQGEGCVVLEEVDFNYFSSRLQVQRSLVFEDGRQAEQEISIRAYSLHEIGKVLHHAGFRVIEVSGGPQIKGRFFGAHSRQLLVLAEKKSTP